MTQGNHKYKKKDTNLTLFKKKIIVTFIFICYFSIVLAQIIEKFSVSELMQPLFYISKLMLQSLLAGLSLANPFWASTALPLLLIFYKRGMERCFTYHFPKQLISTVWGSLKEGDKTLSLREEGVSAAFGAPSLCDAVIPSPTPPGLTPLHGGRLNWHLARSCHAALLAGQKEPGELQLIISSEGDSTSKKAG